MAYQPKDTYFKRAKREGYRSRAAYKLLELNRRFRLIKPGHRVVDLGAAPGGWLQVASKLIGEPGKVVGVDLQSMEPFRESNIDTLQGDITSEHTQIEVKKVLGGPADCVLSDLSPRLSGIHATDLCRSLELAQAAFTVAKALLKPNGGFMVKTFVGDDTTAFLMELKPFFASIHRTRAEATRKGSSEMYLIACGFQPESLRQNSKAHGAERKANSERSNEC